MTKGGTKCRLENESDLFPIVSPDTASRLPHDTTRRASRPDRGYTYPATYKVCTVSALRGRPNPHTGLHRLAPHRCRATPDWRGFLTAIGSRFVPIGRPFDQTPPVGRTGLDTRPSRQRWGDYWLSKGRRFASLPAKASKLSALAGRKPRATMWPRPPLLPRPLGHHTPLCGRTAGPPGTGLSGPPYGEDTGSPWGGEERSGALFHGPNSHRHRYPYLLGL